MHDAEDLESIPDLHALCNLMQTLRRSSSDRHPRPLTIRVVMLNDQSIYEYVLRDDVFVDMVGILECESLFDP